MAALDPDPSCTVFFVGPKTVQTDLLISYLEQESGVTCRHFHTLDDALLATEKQGPAEVIAWDVRDGGEQALGKLESIPTEILERHNVLLLNVKRHLNLEKLCIDHGVDGLIYEDDPAEHLPKAVRAVLAGQLWLSRDALSGYIRTKRTVKSDPRIVPNGLLTAKEIEILAYLASGWSNRQIAEKLNLSPNTIKTHVYRIFKKINVSSRTEAALWAEKHL
jgi:DNA-binding NarL/FixJ family response regulator